MRNSIVKKTITVHKTLQNAFGGSHVISFFCALMKIIKKQIIYIHNLMD